MDLIVAVPGRRTANQVGGQSTKRHQDKRLVRGIHPHSAFVGVKLSPDHWNTMRSNLTTCSVHDQPTDVDVLARSSCFASQRRTSVGINCFLSLPLTLSITAVFRLLIH